MTPENETQRGASLGVILTELAVPTLYRTNAFRLTGLSTHLARRNIARQVQLLQMKTKLAGEISAEGLLPLDVPPTADALRSAAQLLKDTEQRFLHELFWVWTEPLSDDDNREMVKTHNAAVLSAAEALDLELLDEAGGLHSERDRQHLWSLWKKSAVAWAAVLGDARFWTYLQGRISELDDPRLGQWTILELHDGLPMAIAKIHAIQAYRSGLRQGVGIARQHATWTKRFAGERAMDMLVDALRPLREQASAACMRLGVDVKRTPSRAAEYIRDFLARWVPLVSLADAILDPTHLVASDLADTVVATARDLVIGYYNSTPHINKPELVLNLLEQLMTMAHGQILHKKLTNDIDAVNRITIEELYLDPIGHALEEIDASGALPAIKYSRLVTEVLPIFRTFQNEHGADDKLRIASVMIASALRGLSVDLHNEHDAFELALQVINSACDVCLDPELLGQLHEEQQTLSDHNHENKLFAGLEPISTAPSLYCLNGWGTRLYGRTGADSGTGTYLTTRYFTAFFIPLCPIARYRVKELGGGTYRFLGKATLRSFDKAHAGAFVLALLILAFSLVLTDNSPSVSTPPTSREIATEAATPVVVQPNPVTAPTSGTLPSSDGSTASSAAGNNAVVVVPPSAIARSDPDTPSRSSGVASQLSDETATLRASIEADRNRLTQMKTELDDIDRQVEQTNESLSKSKTTLALMKNQNEVDDATFNRAVGKHNQLVDRYNQLLRDEKEKAAEYHAVVAEVNVSIDRYNALVRQK